jgi:NAD(P)-dependent dehydrogenase (short-subunit alcohol dehydrogenase family)
MTETFRVAGLLSGKVMVIAGVGSGLGAYIARGAVAAGARVVLGARSHDVGEGLVAELGMDNAAFQRCDVTVDADCDDLVGLARGQFGGIDAIALNAMASARPGTTLEAGSIDDWREAFEVNVFGSLRVVKAALESLQESPDASVVMVGSQIIRRVFPGRGAYASSKAALVTAAQVLARELGPDGIRVNTVVPGRMWGESLQRAAPSLALERGTTEAEEIAKWIDATALKRLATDEECSRVVLFLASGLAAAVTGQCIDANAGETMV